MGASTKPSMSQSEIVAVRSLSDHHDQRGSMIEIVDDGRLRRGEIVNLHVVTAAPGATRGNHVHPRRTEVVAVIGGDFLARFEETTTGKSLEVEVRGGGTEFEIPPNVAHAFQNIGTSIGYLLCYADIPFDSSDLIRQPILDD